MSAFGATSFPGLGKSPGNEVAFGGERLLSAKQLGMLSLTLSPRVQCFASVKFGGFQLSVRNRALKSEILVQEKVCSFQTKYKTQP